MLQKIPLEKINVTKNALFFLSRVPTHHSLLLICDSYMSWSIRFVSLKLFVGFCNSDSISFLWKFILLFIKMHGHFDFKTSWFLSKSKNRKVAHSLLPSPLLFKLQQKVLKFNDICVRWNSQKTDLVTNLLNLENWSFENVFS